MEPSFFPLAVRECLVLPPLFLPSSLRALSTVSFAHGSGALLDGEATVELINCSAIGERVYLLLGGTVLTVTGLHTILELVGAGSKYRLLVTMIPAICGQYPRKGIIGPAGLDIVLEVSLQIYLIKSHNPCEGLREDGRRAVGREKSKEVNAMSRVSRRRWAAGRPGFSAGSRPLEWDRLQRDRLLRGGRSQVPAHEEQFCGDRSFQQGRWL